MNSRLKKTIFASAMVAACCGVTSAEESSVLDLASVLTISPMWSGSSDLQNLIGKSFKSPIISDSTHPSYADDSKEFTIDLGSALAVRTVHLTNLQFGNN